MRTKKLPKILKKYCIGCGHCVLACHPGCLEVKKGKSTLVNPKECDSEGRCISACPVKAIPHLEDQRY